MTDAKELPSLLDFAFDVWHLPERPLDFGLVVTFKSPHQSPTEIIGKLRTGFSDAQSMFRRLNGSYDGTYWRYQQPAALPVQLVAMPSASHRAAIETFANETLEPRGLPLRQWLLFDGETNQSTLLTRMHHLVGDAQTRLAIVQAQLACLFDKPNMRPSDAPLELLTHPEPQHLSPDAPPNGATRLFTPPDKKRASYRKHLTFEVEYSKFVDKHRNADHTYNDMLVAATLHACRVWNERHRRGGKVGVFLSYNIRKKPFAGFGNGSSRLLIYDNANENNPRDQCDDVRKQVRWAKKHGQWFARIPGWVEKIPRRLLKFMVRVQRRYTQREVGSTMFVHIQRVGEPLWETHFERVRSIYFLGALQPQFPLMLTCVTFRGLTWVTLTYDSAQIDAAQAQGFKEQFERFLFAYLEQPFPPWQQSTSK